MTPLLRIRGLVRRFGPAVALDGIDLDVTRGERLGLAGTNGSGRTTLLRIAAALMAPSTGRIEVAGIDAVLSPVAARAHALYVDSSLTAAIGLTVGEYLTFVRAARARRTQPAGAVSTAAALERTGLEAGAEADSLSPGLRKQLALTAAILVSPPLLLLDDPFSGLDASARETFLDWMRELSSAGVTIVTSVNGTETDGALCTSVVTLSRGRIVTRTDAAQVAPTERLMRAVGGG